MLLARLEGTTPALETAHAITSAAKVVPEMDKDQEVVINLSDRGDKDVTVVMRLLGGEL
ncbi:hypothetical protein MHTCC0001_36300 [Flavobacteriaceae bacterium MHTCC 0001]